MEYKEIIEKIKSLEMQGAEYVAISAVEAFAIKLKETKNYDDLKKYYEELKATRETEPALRNSLGYCLENYKKNPDVAAHVIKHFKDSKEKIIK